MLMTNLSKLVVPNLSLLWMDILSLSSSRMVWPMPPPLENPQIRTWTQIHMSSSHLLMNGTTQSLTMILHILMDATPVKSLTNLLVTPCLTPIEISMNILLDAPPEDCGSYTEISSVFTANLHLSSPEEPDWNALRPFFAWTSPSSIKDTSNVTTRHGIAPHTQDYIKKHFKSRNPVFNIPRRSEAVATDTIFSDTPVVDDGSTMAQFFCGRDTLVCDAYGIKSTKQFINTLSDNIRKRGAMDTLISDGGKYEISQRVNDLLRSLLIQDYQSEPYHQHQNMAENRFGLAKRYTNTVMNTSGCPACCWLLCLQYICVVLNHVAFPYLQGIVSSGGSSLRILKGSSFVLAFAVLSELQQTSILHHLQGRGPHFLFPFLIINNLQILCHMTPLMHQHPILSNLSKNQSGEDEDNPINMANIDIPNLLGRSFLLPPEDNGECHMAKIIDIDDHGKPLEDIKFKLKINKDQAEEVISYNQLMDYLQKITHGEEDLDSLFKFRDIVAHQGPLESTDPNHKGSKYNVMVEWEYGDVTYEPLTLISEDDPITSKPCMGLVLGEPGGMIDSLIFSKS